MEHAAQWPQFDHSPSPELWLSNIFLKNGQKLTETQAHNLTTYTHRLLEWNTKVNLISRKDAENVWQAHILHSLSILLTVDIPPGLQILDLGSGGGLPGVVLKIVRPDLDVVCLDATRKKMDAVQEILTEMELAHVRVAWGRAEVLGQTKEYAKSFDLVVARAVASLRDLVSWSKPFLRRRQTSSGESRGERSVEPPALIALKGGNLSQELQQAQTSNTDIHVREKALVFHGAEEIPGVEKKLIIVEF